MWKSEISDSSNEPTRDDHADDDVEVSFEITTPDDADQEFNIRLWTGSDGYTRLKDLLPEEEDSTDTEADCDDDGDAGSLVYLHQLNSAIEDPYAAFDGGATVTHHKSHIEIDAPDYVEALTPADHAGLHAAEVFRYDEKGIPVRDHADDVPEGETVEIEPPGRGDLSRWALPPQTAEDGESDDTAAESDDDTVGANVATR